MGFSKIGNQAFKLLGHRRLHEMAKMWEERYPGVDIVLIEPEPTDALMFETSIMSFSSRIDIARHGFQSVTYHLLDEYERYSEIWARHGIEISERRVRRVVVISQPPGTRARSTSASPSCALTPSRAARLHRLASNSLRRTTTHRPLEARAGAPHALAPQISPATTRSPRMVT